MSQAVAPHPAELVPPNARLSTARLTAAGCRACDLWERATQTVFGEGPRDAPLMLVGEQPGDQEDVAGRPFVGPAGRVLDQALADADIDREQVFVTNVVKHFRWRPSPGGKRRLHEKPNARQVRACRPWVDLELDLVEPRVVVALGATAAQALIDPSFRISEERGVVLPPVEQGGPRWLATPHPSSILRLTDADEREAARRILTADLATAWQAATA
ncbi:MAG: UdgX family uracil-DNA binding protein [Chloroflexota bacterium]